MVKTRIFIYISPFDGLPKESDFAVIEEELPVLKDGEMLMRAEYISVDPYMRLRGHWWSTGKPFVGQQVAKIIDSKNSKYPVGKYVVNSFGWQSHIVANALQPPESIAFGYILPELGDLSPSVGCGVLGLPGFTAYFGTVEVLKPKAGETLVVSSAAGAVGHIVGQIAKIKGAKVIGITGSDDKGHCIVNELGFDNFINYKTSDVDKVLGELAPEGVDCYFDTVGGETTNAVINNMNHFGRVAACGVISVYNDDVRKAGISEIAIISKSLTIQGVVVMNWTHKWIECVNQHLQWILEGKLIYKETVTEGFDNLPRALIGMLSGRNTGKAVVKV